MRDTSPRTALPDAAQAQHAGRRSEQQDACGFSRIADADFAAHGGVLAVLADGMGGMHHGAWAATSAVQAFIEAYHTKTAAEPIPAALQRALAVANGVVHDEACRLDAVDRIGTTLAAAVVIGHELHWLNVGDSRVYVCEQGHLMRLSTDHRYSALLRHRVRRGELSAGEAAGHPLRDALTAYLGRPAPVPHAASGAALQLRPGAWVLLCSDGLNEALSDDEIAARLQAAADGAQDVAEALVQAALGRTLPEQDNVSVVLLRLPPSAAGAADNPPAMAAPRPRWREPLAWLGAGAALAALALAWLAWVPPAPPPGPGSGAPGSEARRGPSVDLLAPAAPPASAR